MLSVQQLKEKLERFEFLHKEIIVVLKEEYRDSRKLSKQTLDKIQAVKELQKELQERMPGFQLRCKGIISAYKDVQLRDERTAEYNYEVYDRLFEALMAGRVENISKEVEEEFAGW